MKALRERVLKLEVYDDRIDAFISALRKIVEQENKVGFNKMLEPAERDAIGDLLKEIDK